MEKKITKILTVVFMLVIASSVFSQSKTIEERLSDLEKRVQSLEAKLGSSSQTTTKQETNQLTEEIVFTAIKELFKKEVPPTWAGSLMGGRNGIIEKIEIKQVGKYNEQSKYWPVKCRVKGSCTADFIAETKTTNFDKVGDFKIKQDDYGKWYADIDTF